MKATRSGIAFGLAFALLVPSGAAGQEASSSPDLLDEDPALTLAITDSSGDLTDITTGEATDGPGYTDITGLDVSVEGDVLTVRFDVAEDVPEAPDPMFTTVLYYLMIDTDGDGFQNRHVVIRSEDGWNADVYDWDATEFAPMGDAVVVGGSLSASVPVSSLSLTPDARFHGLMQAMDSPDPVGDPLNVVEWEDRVPDREGRWLMLRDATPDVAKASEAVSPAFMVLDGILSQKGKDIKPVSKAKMLKAIDGLYAQHGEAMDAVAGPCGEKGSKRDLRASASQMYKKPGTSYPGQVAASFMAWVLLAYETVEDPSAKRTLARLADMAFDRAATTSIDKRAGRPLSEFAKGVRSTLDFNLNDPGYYC